MQMGISLDEAEIKELIRNRVSVLTGESADDLEVHVTCWNGRLTTCCTHLDYKKHIHMKDPTP